MQTIIVADIGGTNTRFALAKLGEQCEVLGLSQPRDFSNKNFECFSDCLAQFFDGLTADDERPVCASFAVAGKVGGEVTRLTNLNWTLRPRALCQQFGLARVELLNDFAALACATSYLKDTDILTLQTGNSRVRQDGQRDPRVIVGPGTGLGMAALIHDGRRWVPLASEGGHRGFAPETQIELEIYRQLRGQSGYVSAEQLLSGAGLQNLYRALAKIRQATEWQLTPAEISELALLGECPIAVEALHVFCGQLGSVCGDAALTFGASGGVFVGGGILPRLQNFLLKSDFVERFNNKGKQRGYVEQLDVHLITKDNPALLGAAAWLAERLPDSNSPAVNSQNLPLLA